MRRLNNDQRLAGHTLLGMAALSLAARFVTPSVTLWVPPCPFYQFTGLYCPGCGATRMLYLLIHGHPLLASHENALVLLTLPFVIAGLLLQLVGKRSLIPACFAARVGPVVVTVVILFTVARNLPLKPFQILAPQQIAQLIRAPQ